jgi:hypothetical protein
METSAIISCQASLNKEDQRKSAAPLPASTSTSASMPTMAARPTVSSTCQIGALAQGCAREGFEFRSLEARTPSRSHSHSHSYNALTCPLMSLNFSGMPVLVAATMSASALAVTCGPRPLSDARRSRIVVSPMTAVTALPICPVKWMVRRRMH